MSDPFANLDEDAIKDRIKAAQRLSAIQQAREHLIPFTQLMMPDPERPDDITASRYQVRPHHRMIAETFERVVRKQLMCAGLSIPPQHGKSELISRKGIAWAVGREPNINLMFGTYNQTFAEKFGGQVRAIMQNRLFREVFPRARLKRGSESKSEMETTEGGQLNFVGRDAGATGRPADAMVIDDPLKDMKEAQSLLILEQLWDWYTSVMETRGHVGTSKFIVHTRWTENDLLGRLCDPDHPEHDAEIAAEWLYINIPAILEDPTCTPAVAAALGKEIGDVLWPERFPLDFLNRKRRQNPRVFEALYQGRPAPDDGAYFKADHIVEWRDPAECPAQLTMYAASDHALTEKQQNDPSCLGAFGVDCNDHIWIMPDLVWERMETDRTLEEMIELMRRHRPAMWWAEDEHINKALGPFRRKRQAEEKIYTTVEGIRPSRDLQARARSIQGRMSMRMVHFPVFAPWWSKARNELLKFPTATHDDFVAFMALIGLGLDRIHGATRPKDPEPEVKVGSIAWIKRSAARLTHGQRQRAAMRGY